MASTSSQKGLEETSVVQHSNTEMESNSDIQNEEDGFMEIDPEALFQILARVPPESLVHCKSVGKCWLSTIRDPNFLKFRCDIQKSNRLFIIEKNSWFEFYAFAFGVESGIFTGRTLQHSCCLVIRIEDTCDGLILHKSIFESDLHIYNSCTGATKTVTSHEPPTSSKNYYSLAYDASIQKYKLVWFCLSKSIIKCYIFVLGRNHNTDRNENADWRELSFAFPQIVIPRQPTIYFDRVVCNGALNWIAEIIPEENEEQGAAFVISIDIASEELRDRIELPSKPNICFTEMFNCKLLVSNGFLCYANPTSKEEFHFWVLRDAANHYWMKQLTLRLSSMLFIPDSLRTFLCDDFLPLAIINESEKSCPISILILHCHRLFLYNVESQELRVNVLEEAVSEDAYFLPFSTFTFINRPIRWD
ncbi:hypothetical protein F2P56_029591 [Juglans regia]|uniref:F-box protein At3g23260 n=2 Tax=Juglans regia TaxID=51240 RepID=A0A2I4FBQ4_JUGRE|nr:putative F-box protein At3g23260 [Juglans regia]KAF5449111.1 hypothetical protein F2P56_029591 [Juglans regia]